LPLWKVVVIVPFLLIINLLYVLMKMDIVTLQESTGLDDDHHHHHHHLKHLRDNFQSPPQQQQQQSSVTKASPTIPNRDEYLTNLKALEKTLNARSCQRQNDKKDGYILNGDFCSESTTSNFLYYNSLPLERILCGQIIPPNSHITTNQKCLSPARLFMEIPQITGNMKPVQLSFRTSSQNRAKPFPCDIPCHSVEGGGVVQTRYVTPIDNSKAWQITFSMEGPMYYRQLAIHDGEYKKHHYYSTTSYESEVPLPYFSWAEYDIHSPSPVNFDTAIKGASFMAKNCASRNKREALVQELSQHFRVDALSLCLHNAEPPPGANLRDKIQTMRFYLFHLAFENQCYPDYITEKLWGPMQSGTIPVYFGSPNAQDHAPNNSLILVDDFPDVAALGKYLNKVANNRTLFEFHQQWRKEPLPPHFHARYDFTEVHSTCRTCRWAYSKFYGLGWNHKNQSLRELEVPRYPCVNDDGQLLQPFAEQWLTSSYALPSLVYNGPSQRTCHEHESVALANNTLGIGGALRRTVWQQDGVIDMRIDLLDPGTAFHPHIMQIRAPFIRGNETVSMKEIETGHTRIQNDKARFTILTWPKRNVKLKQNDDGGVVEVNFDEASHLPLKLRLIVEDVETLRKGADQDENFFGGLMKRDFFNPVEVFLS
jgi:hypothetical protein